MDIETARAVGGLMTLMVLLGLFVAEFVLGGTINQGRIAVFLVLIAGLLGVDVISEYLPLRLELRKINSDDQNDEDR